MESFKFIFITRPHPGHNRVRCVQTIGGRNYNQAQMSARAIAKAFGRKVEKFEQIDRNSSYVVMT